MKIAVKLMVVLAVGLFSMTILPAQSVAASRDKVTEIKNELKEYRRLESSIHKHASRLSAGQKARLKASLPKSLHDSDSDGVPDIIENHVDGTNDCDASDHDGGLEVETKGTVSSVSGANFSAGGKDFTLSGSVVYRDGDASALIVGACVEVKGTTTANSTVITATRVSFKNSDDCA